MHTLVLIVAVALLASGPAIAGDGDAARPAGCRGASGWSEAFGGRRTFLWRPAALQSARARDGDAGKDHAADDPAITQLLADADAALSAGPWSVTHKTRPPASGALHDYASMGPYWWPDPGRRDGAPYVRRDGDINPERDGPAFDLKRMEAMSSAVEALALAYYATDDRRYAERAALVIRTWFLSAQTRMNPNADHAQSIPGRTPGRAEGVIDLRHLVPVVEAIGLLGPSGALDENEYQALRRWFGQLTVWLATSPLGSEERAAENNHGIFYDLLLAEFALFAGHEAVAAQVLRDFPKRRIVPQFAADGSLPRELARTRSFHYSTWTMGAVYDLATLGECVDTDLWNASDAMGRGLPAATTFLASHAGREAEWKWPEKKLETREYYVALRKAAWGYRDRTLSEKADRYAPRHARDRIGILVPPLPGGPAQHSGAVP